MIIKMRTTIFSAILLSAICAPGCFAQSLLDQSGDDLLKGFDLDQGQINQYQQQLQPPSKMDRLLSIVSAIAPRIDVNTDGGTSVRVKSSLIDVDIPKCNRRHFTVSSPFLSVNSSTQAPSLTSGASGKPSGGSVPTDVVTGNTSPAASDIKTDTGKSKPTRLQRTDTDP